MGRNGGCNFSDWEELRAKLETTQTEMQIFIESCAKELAARLLTKVIKRTKPGEYDQNGWVRFTTSDGKDVAFQTSVVKKGGTLRRGWTSKTHEEAASGSGGGANATVYAKSLPIKKSGSTYQIEVVNPVEYASYVEFGHKTPYGNGYVEPKYILTVSEQEIQRASPAILEKKIQKKLGECFR